MAPSSSFTTRRINYSTYVIREDDAFGEHPLIYVKLSQKVPVIILSDTGCDEPSKEHKHGESCVQIQDDAPCSIIQAYILAAINICSISPLSVDCELSQIV